ncbi:hypothetical protein ACXIUH_04375 [Vibrio parahaemolyticus]|nr:hypothetical protein [Vibrio parahaemolyticus]
MDKHKFYDFIDTLIEKSKFKISIIKTLSARNDGGVYFILDVFYITGVCYKNVFFMKKDFVILREFNTIPFLISSLFLFPISKSIILNVNHNFQKASKSITHKIALKFFDLLGFSYLCFEGRVSPLSLTKKIISIPFPMNEIESINEIKGKLSIGFIGSYRSEKKIEPLLASLNELKDHYRLVLGTDRESLLEQYEQEGWSLYNTANYTDYLQAINETDVLVVNYGKDDYDFRHSGVITDFISQGKLVIVPNFRYFSEQILTPCRVGGLFDELDCLPSMVRQNIDFLLSEREINIHKYIEYRSYSSVVHMMDEQLGLRRALL